MDIYRQQDDKLCMKYCFLVNIYEQSDCVAHDSVARYCVAHCCVARYCVARYCVAHYCVAH
jgi:hypothetical protein